MIGTTLHEYLFILLSILALRLIAPASILYIIYSACALFDYTSRNLFFVWILAYAIAETLFCFGVYWPQRIHLNKGILHDMPTPLTRVEREALFSKCASIALSFPDPLASYPLGWFLTQGKLKRQNVVEWLLWALYSCEPRDAPLDEWKDELDGYIRRIEERIGYKLEDGYGNTVRSMRLSFDPVRTTYRPLIWYLTVGAIDMLTASRLYFLGFTHYSPNRPFRSIFSALPFRIFTLFSRTSATPFLPYWCRPHTSSNRDPIVFIHGIGIGLHPYIPLIAKLVREDPEVGILLVELLPISNRILLPILGSCTRTFPIAIRQTMLDALRAVLVAHSYGTAIAAHDIHTRLRVQTRTDTDPYHDVDPTDDSNTESRLPIFTSYLLIDPISLLLHLPPVAYSFLYRSPWRNRSNELAIRGHQSLWQKLFNGYNGNEWQLWYFASRDLEVAHTLSRRFFWNEVVLWKEDLGLTPDAHAPTSSSQIPVGIVLSGNDQIVPADTVRSYLTGGGDAQHSLTSGERDCVEDVLMDISEDNDSQSSHASSSSGWTHKRMGAFEHYHFPQARFSNTNNKASQPSFRLEEILYYPGLDHATVFDTSERRQGLLDTLRRYSTRSIDDERLTSD
ncbi:alpha beta hydrolase fold family [Moniliophthora roreri MCA 2997]|uniref:Alpha beta hydrolase fold family n=1 Tax=Moniliophthora roreri (strain MCA 2997) TaxID=1381753 RepID=V2Y014_MONRO|nr:alpha beta hydrolase fold family [Moniliophthora roreri MCA 2997]